jgi:hypothetical protein
MHRSKQPSFDHVVGAGEQRLLDRRASIASIPIDPVRWTSLSESLK